MWRPSPNTGFFYRAWRCEDSHPARCLSNCTEICKSSAGVSQPRRSQFRRVSAMVASTSSRSCSSPPESGQPAGSAEFQTCVRVSLRRGRSPLFQAKRSILAFCSESGVDFVLIIMRRDAGHIEVRGAEFKIFWDFIESSTKMWTLLQLLQKSLKSAPGVAK
jgi:hypothetical protein